jgi:hypothetical protein
MKDHHGTYWIDYLEPIDGPAEILKYFANLPEPTNFTEEQERKNYLREMGYWP